MSLMSGGVPVRGHINDDDDDAVCMYVGVCLFLYVGVYTYTFVSVPACADL